MTLQDLIDRQAIIDTIDGLFIATDERDWDAVCRCLAPTVELDMTSLAGGEPAGLRAEQVAAGWETGLAPITQVHHQTGNHRVRVDGDLAQASCYSVAWHYHRVASGRNTRCFVGSYDFRLRRGDGGWRIEMMRFDAKFVDGNLQLDSETAEAG